MSLDTWIMKLLRLRDHNVDLLKRSWELCECAWMVDEKMANVANAANLIATVLVDLNRRMDLRDVKLLHVSRFRKVDGMTGMSVILQAA